MLVKAKFEKVQYNQQSSWSLLVRTLDALDFEWHFHPEYELTLTLNSKGELYVGDHISIYDQDHLTLIGPNLPHTWQASAKQDNSQAQTVFVLWFEQRWVDNLTRCFPEFSDLTTLFNDSLQGVIFSADIIAEVRPLFFKLIHASASEKLILLLEILNRINPVKRTKLTSDGYQNELKNSTDLGLKEQQTLSQLLKWIHQHYIQPITLARLANQFNMSESKLVRFFQRYMGQGVNQYITQVRLGHACSLLIHTEYAATVIANSSGFSNQANFNRLFKKYKLMTPREFRQKFR